MANNQFYKYIFYRHEQFFQKKNIFIYRKYQKQI